MLRKIFRSSVNPDGDFLSLLSNVFEPNARRLDGKEDQKKGPRM